jgi:hypothetical protein
MLSLPGWLPGLMMRSRWSQAGSSAGRSGSAPGACLAGMLSGLDRRTGWSLAEQAGEKSPDGMQRLFTTRPVGPGPGP